MIELCRPRRPIPSSADCNSSMDRKYLLGLFDSEPGYYQQVIRPLLAPGRTADLIHWLRHLGLLRSKQTCMMKFLGKCQGEMAWQSASGEDLFQWECNGCSEKRPIRDHSIFSGVECDFMNAIRVLLGWCKGRDVDTVANMLGIRCNIVSDLYIKTSKLAEKAIQANITDWQFGGPGIVVIIDIYPEVCTDNNRRIKGRPILCISEVKSMPQKYWLEALESCNGQDVEQVEFQKYHILHTIRSIVLPGSMLVIPSTSTMCSPGDFDILKPLYPIIVSTNDLTRHDTEHQSVFVNLETIWKSILDVCEEAQFCNTLHIQQFVIGHLWSRRHGQESFQMLLYLLGSR